MVAVVRLSRFGGPEVLQIENVPLPPPRPGEAWVEQEAIGVNYLDVMQRNGAVRVPLPSGLGLEGAGRVTAVGTGVSHAQEGDCVAYATGPMGAYASGRLYPAERLLKMPEATAHADLESGRSSGAIILEP